MNTLSFHPLFPLFNVCVTMMARKVWPQGYDVSMDDAPDSLKRLKKEYAERGRITVYGGHSDRTIYDSAEVNQDFRAWHDWCHLTRDADFSLKGEQRAFQEQARHVIEHYGNGDTGRELVRILHAEVMGQALYYQVHKKYVIDQRAFVLAFMHQDPALIHREW